MKDATFICQPYNARIDIVHASTDDMPAARAKYDTLFGPVDRANRYAFFDGNGINYFSVFFTDEAATDEIAIVHEVFHLTGGILHGAGVRYDWTNDEPFAYLHGYLFGEVAKILREFNKPKPKRRTRK